MPGLIWVRGLVAGEVMVDGSFRVERLQPLGLWWTATLAWEPRNLWELAGSLRRILESWAAELIEGVQVVAVGSSASGPSALRAWKERRASLRAIVSDARVCERPRALSAR